MDRNESFTKITLIGIEAALQAGDLLRQGYGTHLSIQSKEGKHNLVTEYDHLSEHSIIEFIKTHHPSSQFLAEESGRGGDESSSVLWIIDPLDGTVNFAHQIPEFSISIAAYKEKQLVSGIVYQPMTHELFVAEKGTGAFLNGHRLHVSSTEILDESLVVSEFPYNLSENPHNCIEQIDRVLRRGISTRRIGTEALELAYLAAGRFDGFFEAGLNAWDRAAGILLVEEAKGKVSDWKGRPIDLFADQPLLATNGHIHQAFLSVFSHK